MRSPIIVYKTCACGRRYYTRRQWRALPLVGHMTDRELLGWGERQIEMRNCVCRSTISVASLSWWRVAGSVAVCVVAAAPIAWALDTLVHWAL